MAMKVAYRIGDDGYLEGTVNYQEMEGVFLPPNCTLVAPGDTENFYQKWDADKKQWIQEPKPKTAAEFEGLRIDHYDRHERIKDLRQRVQEYGDKDGRRVIRGDNLEWMSVAIPESEGIEQEIQKEQSDMDSQLRSLRDRMTTAMLQNNQEAVKTLQAEYQTYLSTYTNRAAGIATLAATAEEPDYGHCPLCDSPLDKDGICTSETCPRRALQQRLKNAREQAKKDNEETTAKAKAWHLA